MHFIAEFLCGFQEILKRVMQFCKIIIIIITIKRSKTITFHHTDYFQHAFLQIFYMKNSFSIKLCWWERKVTHLENLKLLIFLERGQGQKNIFAWKWRNIKMRRGKMLETKIFCHPSLTKNRWVISSNLVCITKYF